MTYQKTSQKNLRKTSKKLKFLEVPNTILEDVFNDWKGTAFHNQHTYHFFMQIKELCPQTVFHGTDVGHQYGTTGERFLRYLENRQQQNSPSYLRTQEIIRQGIAYYNDSKPHADVYRENMMVDALKHIVMRLP